MNYCKLKELGAGTRAARRAVALAASLAMVVGGCVVAPVQPPEPAPPARNQAQSQPMRQAGPTTDFHANPTDRQRFQVRIDFGRIFEKQGNFDAAITEYQEALTVAKSRQGGRFTDADAAVAERRMAVANDRMGRFAQAEVHYKQALKHAPKDPRVWNDVGYSYYIQGRYQDAERALKTASKLAPDDERARLNLGLALAAAGRPEEALPLLSKAGGDAVGHANLGYLLAATGQPELAKLEYRKALAIRPDLEVARRAMASLEYKGANRVAQGSRRPVDWDLKQTAGQTVLPSLPAPRIPPPTSWSTTPPGQGGAQP